MTAEWIYDLMDMAVRFTIYGICACFFIAGIAQIWKWMIELMMAFITYLFPSFQNEDEGLTE